MKKSLLFSIVFLSFIVSVNQAYSQEKPSVPTAIIRTNADTSALSNDKYKITEVNGKYAIIDTETGLVIPEEKLYSVSEQVDNDKKVIVKDKISPIVTDLKPSIKEYFIKQRKKEIAEASVYKVQEVEVPQNVHTVSIEQNVIETTVPKIPVNSAKVLWVGNKKYTVIQKDSLFGLSSELGNEIIPTSYDNLVITNLSNPYVITSKNGAITCFNLNGKVLAEQVYDKVNVYKYGKLYSYTNVDGYWLLKSNNKKIGKLIVNGTNYSFEKESKLNIFNYTAVNDIFMTILKSASK